MTKIKNTQQLSADILAPLIKHCTDNRGATTKVAELFNAGLKEKVRLTTIGRWLCKDESKRIEPTAGSLLRLLEVWRELRGQDVEGWRDQTIFCAANGCKPSRNGEHCITCGRNFSQAQ